MRLYLATALLALHSAYGQNGEMDRFNRKARPMHSDGKEEEHDEPTSLAQHPSWSPCVLSVVCVLSSVPYISCAVCKMAVNEVWRLADEARARKGGPK